LHITHWTRKDLARQAVADGIVTTTSPRTVRQILKGADLQPHRTRSWKTSRLDEQFKRRAEQVLWCYAHAERLARQGIWVVAVDERPNHQVLERNPIRRAIPGSIEQQEFEYTRHGTVNLLFFLIVHSGRMEVAAEDTKDAEHYVRELRAFRRRHHHLKGVFLVQDGDPSHTAAATAAYLAGCGGLVAVPLDAGACLVAEPGGIVDRGVQLLRRQARLLAEPGRVPRACEPFRAGVQPTLCPSLCLALVPSHDAEMVCRACLLNLLHDFVPGPLAGSRPIR
jgi:hypothetical protein